MFARARIALTRWNAEHDEVELEADATNLRRMPLLGATIAALNVTHVLGLLLVMSSKPASDGAAARWRAWLLATHVAMGAVMGLGAWLAARAVRLGRERRVARLLPLGLATAGLGFASLIAVVDQLVTPNITPLVLSTLGVAAMAYLRPRTSALLYLANYGLFFVLVPATQASEAIVLSNRLGALGNTILGWGLSVVFFRHFTTITRQQRALSSANAELERRQHELQELSRRDGLTGLLNREALTDAAAHELRLGRRTGVATALLVIDVDHFKHVNDTWGHPAGDEVLRQLAARLGAAVRATDSAARLGGEEFAILLPATTAEGALNVAEKLRRAVKAEPVEWAGVGIEKTVSVGVSVAAADSEATFSSLYAEADRALYRAKSAGRDQVVLFEAGTAERDVRDAALAP